MSEQIDWSKAPADATHHIAENNSTFECWLKPSHAVRVSRGSSDWVSNDYADKLIADCATPRPATPSWSGEGLPPVGVVCEVKQMARGAEREWFKAEVLYSSPYTVVLDDYQDGEFVSHPCTLQFRPILTPEQTAADERERAIAIMHQDVLTGGYACSMGEILTKLYSAGYRKP